MRVSYTPPAISQFDIVFAPYNANISGGALNDIRVLRPQYYHRGGSLFSILGSMIRKAVPFLTNFILPETSTFASNIAKDFNSTPFKRNMKNNLFKSAKNIGRRMMGGRKMANRKKKLFRNKHVKKKQNTKKQCHVKPKDIFSTENF